MFTIIQSLLGHGRRNARATSGKLGQAARKGRRKLAIETCEKREMMSATPHEVAHELTHSREHLTNVVSHDYQTYLGRSADSAGLNFWVSTLQNGLAHERMEAEFIGSSEYIASHGGAGRGWVSGMYQDLLHRSADDAGLDFWTRGLANGAQPKEVAFGFAHSREREGLEVKDDYRNLLGRSPSDDETNYWVNRRQGGASQDDIESEFVGSDEYYDRHGGHAATWLESAYQDLLGRPSDDGGREHFLGEMEGIRVENGVGRIEGRITALDVGARSVTIATSGNQSLTLTVASDAKIERNDVHVTLASLQVGDQAEARYSPDTLVASKLESVG